MNSRTIFRHLPVGLVLAFALTGAARAQSAGPFSLAAAFTTNAAGAPRLGVTFVVPPDHYLYSEQIAVEAPPGTALAPETPPAPKRRFDPLFEAEVATYEEPVTLLFAAAPDAADGLDIVVHYQGCSHTICFAPHRATLRVPAQGGVTYAPPARFAGATAPAPTSAAPAGWRAWTNRFSLTGRASGYLDTDAFIAFLDRAEAGRGLDDDALARAARQGRIGWLVVLILAGGLLLNLTPCVLPMIPINLAIIGAGAQAGSRGRGFWLGGLYGLGMALVYGALGLVVVLTGAKFGALNASPWFNFGVAALFVVLALASFDVFTIDFSRWSAGAGAGTRRGSAAAALVMGGLAALLAGACVAPVLIGVLLLSADLYGRGQPLGLALPFLLGAGMALPWPLAGAGLAFLPKPGAWMKYVKIGFGLLILGFALWYARLGWTLLPAHGAARAAAAAAAPAAGWETDLSAALARAHREQRPVFVDFWASWCKNCLKMEHTTFADARARERLDRYVRVKYRAEDLGDPSVAAPLDAWGGLGLPTYVVLKPRGE